MGTGAMHCSILPLRCMCIDEVGNQGDRQWRLVNEALPASTTLSHVWLNRRNEGTQIQCNCSKKTEIINLIPERLRSGSLAHGISLARL
jgi:hypothetical protein